ncbi:tetratricopeptide repeat protein [Pontiella sp.]|uniref:GspE/PulE/PilB domain-containing protein n=1 Tax=Pontiella sp. TaxID=2837462 RepID=UPI003567D395
MAAQHSAENLANSVAMLEQILEVMPQDPEALKALYNAYLRAGNIDRAFDYLSRMIEVALTGREEGVLAYIGQELPNFEDSHPSEVAAQIARLRTLFREQPAHSTQSPADDGDDAGGPRCELDINEELALAWRLYEENQLSQEEYSSVLHDLTEISTKELNVPASVLHVLHDRGFTHMGQVVDYMSSRSGVPTLRLKNFELDKKAAASLPLDVAVHDGALPFAFFGNDLLVGVLNPFNNMLVDKVENESGHCCHTFLVEPADYDAALDKLRALDAPA